MVLRCLLAAKKLLNLLATHRQHYHTFSALTNLRIFARQGPDAALMRSASCAAPALQQQHLYCTAAKGRVSGVPIVYHEVSISRHGMLNWHVPANAQE